MTFPRVFLLIVLFCVPFSNVSARPYLDISIGNVNGDFDTGINSRLTSVSVEAGYYGEEYFFSAATSYLSLDTDDLETETGMGDTLLKVGYHYRSAKNDLLLSPYLSLKLPTSDETRGLGSGETDFGAFLDVYKKCASFVCTAGLGYIFVGDPADIEYNNIMQLSVGGFFAFQQAGLSTYIEYNSAMIDGRTDPVELGANWFYLFSLKTAFYIDGTAGLNDAAPDYGIRSGFIFWF